MKKVIGYYNPSILSSEIKIHITSSFYTLEKKSDLIYSVIDGVAITQIFGLTILNSKEQFKGSSEHLLFQ